MSKLYNEAINKYVPNRKIKSDAIELSKKSIILIKQKKTLQKKNSAIKTELTTLKKQLHHIKLQTNNPTISHQPITRKKNRH